MLVINKDSGIALYEQIYNQLKEQILSGEISVNTMLPSTRNLATTLQVSRNTVESAYQQLYSEGYVTSRAGSGYRVESIEFDLLKEIDSVAFEKYHDDELFRSDFENEFYNPGCNFQYGKLRLSDFPLRMYRKLINQILLSSDIEHISAYNDRKGELELRVEIMKYLHESRGVRCNPEQIVICAGTLIGIGLLSQLLFRHTNSIVMEEPCYDSVRSAFMNHGFQVVPVCVEKDGINLERLRESSAKLAYVTPSHQFPTGAVLPINKRLGLIEWADMNDAFLIEDDYDGELRYNSRPIPSMQSLDTKGRVIYINTFSKSFAPGLRLSFMVLPMVLMEEYQRSFSKYHSSAPWLEQKIMSRFMIDGHWSRHLRRICVLNKKRHDMLINTINDVMGDHVTIYGKNAGLHIVLEVHNGLNEKELIATAEAAGVTVYSVSNYYVDPRNDTNNKVLIGFSSLSEDEIVRGINLLKSAWF